MKNTNPKLLMQFYVLIDMHEKCIRNIARKMHKKCVHKLNDYHFLLTRVVNLNFFEYFWKTFASKTAWIRYKKLKNIKTSYDFGIAESKSRRVEIFCYLCVNDFNYIILKTKVMRK